MRFSQLQQLALTVWRSEPRLFTLVLVCAALNLVLLVALQGFLSPAITSVERDMIKLQADVRSLGAGGVALSPDRLYAKAGEDIERVRSLIPAREKLSGLVLDIGKLAEEAGLAIERISYDPEKLESHALLSYSLSFTVNGSYRQLKKFVHLLEVSRRLIVLDSISLVEGGKGAGISMRLKITTFFKESEV